MIKTVKKIGKRIYVLGAFVCGQWKDAPIRLAFDRRRRVKKREEERGGDGFRGGDALNEWLAHTYIYR